VILRTFDPAPGWFADGHRIKAPMDYERGPEKTWANGALRVRDDKVLTAVRHRAIPRATLPRSPTLKPTIRLGISLSSLTT
jgi:hypothetical protein